MVKFNYELWQLVVVGWMQEERAAAGIGENMGLVCVSC